MTRIILTSFALLALLLAGCEPTGSGPGIQPSAYSVGLLADAVARTGGAAPVKSSPPDVAGNAAPPPISQESVDELRAELESIADGFVGLNRQIDQLVTQAELSALDSAYATKEELKQVQVRMSARPWQGDIAALDAKIGKLSDQVEWNRKELQKRIEQQTDCPPPKVKKPKASRPQQVHVTQPKKLDSVTYDGRRVIWEYHDGSRLQESHSGFQQRTGKIFRIEGADIYCPSGTCQWR